MYFYSNVEIEKMSMTSIEKWDHSENKRGGSDNHNMVQSPEQGQQAPPPPNWQYYNVPPQMLLEDQNALDLGKMFRALWHFRGIVASVALILATIMVLGNPYVLPDTYEATARVRVKMISLDDISISRNFSIIPTEVLSDKVLTKVVNDLGLTKKESDPFIVKLLSSIGIKPKENIEDGSGIIRWLRQDVHINQERQGTATAVFTVSLADTDPTAAANIVNAIVHTYIDLRHTFESSDAAESVVFLKPKVDAAQKNVNEAHKQLTEFQMKHSSYLVPVETIEENITRLQHEYTESNNRMEQLSQVNASLKKLLNGESRYVSSGSVVVDTDTAVSSELAQLEQRYVVSQSRYVAGHPYLKQLQDDINALKKASKNVKRAPRSQGSRVTNPAWLQLSQEISANDAEYTMLKRRVPSIERNIVKLSEHLSRATSAQAQLLTHQAAWDQSYNQLRLLNEQFLKVQTQADAQENIVGRDLSILDEAMVPTLPVSASRMKLQIVGLFVSLIGALLVGLIYAAIKKWELPKEGMQVGLAHSVVFNVIGISWFVFLVGYIVINPYI